MKIIEVKDRNSSLIEQLLSVWESAVKATHLFLSEAEIEDIKKYVPQALSEIPHLIIIENDDQVPVGFMGIAEQHLEMLFLSDEERGRGLGRALLTYGIEQYSIDDLAVNEQNPLAKGFYEHMGFEVYKRTEKDEQGNPYPLLYMRRNASKKNFIEALTSERKNKELPEECNFFGKLIGSWKIDYIDNTTSVVRKGEWHFSWVLEGMAIQDVIVLPGFEYGTTLRVFNPDTRGWDVAYCFTGKIMRFEARKEGDRIVLTNTEDDRRKWVFAKIEDKRFHWQDVVVKDDGKWHVNFDLYAERME